ncbi:UbiA prenyltransferase [Mycena leptocephala]|nr:UbiA prenyltransferase [Mycena leptocephala]
MKLLSLPTGTEIQACWELCRLHNNIGFWVVWLPSAWSIAMAYHSLPEITGSDALMTGALYVPLCFGIKSLIMTIDDILDHDIDGVVARTKNRALPRGAISLGRAWLFFTIQVVLGVYLATQCLGETALYISMTVWPLYIIYPTCKRWTYLAPIPLGIMFNVGVFMGWADLNRSGNIPWEILGPIYIGACSWTVTYETVYQHQDKQDDVKIGLKSLAILCGRHTIPICTITGSTFVALLVYGGMLNGQGIPFFLSVTVVVFRLLSSLWRTDIDEPESCKALFLGTPLLGQIILGGLCLDAVVHRLKEGIRL